MQGESEAFFEPIILQTPPTRVGWEYLYGVYSYLGIISAIFTFGLIIYFCVKYRARSGLKFGINNSATRENRDSNWKGPLLICVSMGIILVGVGSQSFIIYNAFSTPIRSPNTLHITVIAHQFAWTFVYPNGFVSEDVAVVPTNTVVVFNVTSRDVYHQFGLPYFRVKTDAIPGRMSSV